MQTATDWPTTRWELSAPESYVLLHGVDQSGAEPFKLAVMELVARQSLAIADVETRSFFGRIRHTSVLTSGAKGAAPAEASLAAVWQLFQSVPLKVFPNGTSGIAVADFAQAAQRRYQPLSRYAVQDVVPTLLIRGLLRREERRVLFLFSTMKYVLTPEGSAARADLERRIDLGQAQLPGWAQSDPNRALMYAGLAGASLLLMPMVFPELGDLHRRLRESASGSDSGTSIMASNTPDGDDDLVPDESLSVDPLGAELAALDLGSFDFGGIDFGAFADMDATFSAIDSGVDSGGGDGGGDGGGGDGGGGGD